MGQRRSAATSRDDVARDNAADILSYLSIRSAGDGVERQAWSTFLLP
jgi:hypothetical protein